MFPIDGHAVKAMLLSPILVDHFGNLLRVPLMLPLALCDRQGLAAALRSQWQAALVVATLGPANYALVLHALTMAPLSHVAPAREVSMLFAALLGGHLLGEGDRKAHLAGAAAIALGVAGPALGRSGPALRVIAPAPFRRSTSSIRSPSPISTATVCPTSPRRSRLSRGRRRTLVGLN